MKLKIRILVIFMAVLHGFAYGQREDIANEYLENNMYREALPVFEKLYKNSKKGKGEYAYSIAECYRNMNRTEEALPWYDSAMVHQCADPKLALHYGESLMRVGRYVDAQKILKTYVEVNPGDEYSRQKLESSIFANDSPDGNPYIKVEPLSSINTDGYEYGIADFQGRLVYAHSSRSKWYSFQKGSRTGTDHSKLYIVDSMNKPSSRVLKGMHKRNASEGGFTYDSLMEVAYTTRSSNKAPHTTIVAYQYNPKKDSWSKPAKAIRSKLFSIDSGVTGHPFITEDGQRMYFAGILQGGYGGSDIWYVNRQPDGSWGQAINAGPNVNTVGEEVFPTAFDGVLYFSSTGHVGYGGLDIFACELDANGGFRQAQNLGQFINSSKDDMSLLLSKKMRRSFFVSDAQESTFDDIYTFSYEYKHPHNLQVIGKVVDTEYNPIPDARVSISVQGEDTITVSSDSLGKFVVNVLPEKEALFDAQKDDYLPKQLQLPAFTDRFGLMDLTNRSATPNAVIVMSKPVPEVEPQPEPEPEPQPVVVPDVVAPVVEVPPVLTIAKLRNVYYGFDKSDICSESLVDLDKLIDYLKQFPASQLQLASHTDSRGSAAYNQTLSVKRAQYVLDYLKTQGVQEQVSYKAYGKSQLYIADARNEQEHWLNRRTEFAVLNENGEVQAQSNPVDTSDFANFCGGVGQVKANSEKASTLTITGHFVQVCILPAKRAIDAQFKEKVERLTSKQMQQRWIGKNICYYVEFETQKDAHNAAKLLNENGVDVLERIGF